MSIGQGRIIKTYNGYYYVDSGIDELVTCKVKGKLKQIRFSLCTGDIVEFETNHNGESMITRILPRRNFMLRPTIANVDLIIVAFACINPDFSYLLADKLLVASALILFVEQKAMAGWMVCVILARELIITSLRVVAANKGVVMAATWTGKVKTCVQIGGIIIIYLYYIIVGALANGIAFADGDGVTAVMFIPHADGMPLLLTIVGWVVTLVTIYSGYDYLKKNWDLIKDGAVKAK